VVVVALRAAIAGTVGAMAGRALTFLHRFEFHVLVMGRPVGWQGGGGSILLQRQILERSLVSNRSGFA
jgi:hypothetical protein